LSCWILLTNLRERLTCLPSVSIVVALFHDLSTTPKYTQPESLSTLVNTMYVSLLVELSDLYRRVFLVLQARSRRGT